jgi:hypothetical protein
MAILRGDEIQYTAKSSFEVAAIGNLLKIKLVGNRRKITAVGEQTKLAAEIKIEHDAEGVDGRDGFEDGILVHSPCEFLMIITRFKFPTGKNPS